MNLQLSAVYFCSTEETAGMGLTIAEAKKMAGLGKSKTKYRITAICLMNATEDDRKAILDMLCFDEYGCFSVEQSNGCVSYKSTLTKEQADLKVQVHIGWLIVEDTLPVS